jgi:nondiscriminating aspartyl-tRNA synthetase
LKSVAFLILRDAAGLTQIVVSEKSARAQLETLPGETIFRGLELVSGGQRMHRYADYVRTLTARGETDLSAYSGYLDTMRYGMPPHGGFAFGLERFMARLLDVPNVRQVTLFPRDLHRLAP